MLDLIRTGQVDFVVNTPTYGKNITTTGYQVRRTCVEYNVPCLTAVDTTTAFFKILLRKATGHLHPKVISLQEYLQKQRR